MKLLLTSVGWEENPSIGKEFVKLVNKKPSEIKIFFVITPTKFVKRNHYVKNFLKSLELFKISEKNITIFQLDRKITKNELKDSDVVFVFGGNTFEYLDGIRRTGLDKLIINFVKNGGVYLGLSAGSYVVCPTIEMAGWKNADNNEIGLKNLKGLNLVKFLVTAHFTKELYPIIKKASSSVKYPTIALTDKQAVLIKNNEIRIIGSGKKNIFNF